MVLKAKINPHETTEDSLKAFEKYLNEKFPFGIPRKEIDRATGGILCPRTMANLDCLGEGIPGRFKIGRNTIYPVHCAIDYLRSKITQVADGGKYEQHF